MREFRVTVSYPADHVLRTKHKEFRDDEGAAIRMYNYLIENQEHSVNLRHATIFIEDREVGRWRRIP